jgi:hypothetical protein
MDVIIGSSHGLSADSQHFYLQDTEAMAILGTRPRQIAFRPKQISGSKLLASLAEPLPLDTAVRIDHGDAFLLGEVTGCWEVTPGIFLAVVKLSLIYCAGDESHPPQHKAPATGYLDDQSTTLPN